MIAPVIPLKCTLSFVLVFVIIKYPLILSLDFVKRVDFNNHMIYFNTINNISLPVLINIK